MMAMFGGIGAFYEHINGSVTLSLLWHFLGVTLVHYFLIIIGIIVIIIAEFMPEGIIGFVKRNIIKFTGKS